MKCEKCGWDDKGTGDFAHVCGPVEVKKQRAMNERIKELMDKCWEEREVESGLVHRYINQEKFAELIVADCLDIVNRKDYSYHEADPLWETAQLIKEHFGVK